MTDAKQLQAKVRISWPRPAGEMPLWIDLCLARGLRAVSGRAVIPFKQLPSSTERMQFDICRVAEDSFEGQSFAITVEPPHSLIPPSLDLVAINDNQRLRWEPEFEELLRVVEADRLQALADLQDRPMRESAMHLATRMGLGSAEAELLCVLALVRTEEALQETFAERRDGAWTSHLAALLAVSWSTVEQFVGPNSALFPLKLAPLNLLSLEELEKSPLRPVLDSLVRAADGSRDPLASFLAPMEPARLSLADFSQLSVTVDLIVSLMRDAYASHRVGVNVLLHGAPGTGKVQLSRLLANLVAADAFEAPLIDESGDARDGYSRVDSLPLCQQALCEHERPLLIFDKAEDLFPSPPFTWHSKLKEERRDWINRMLKTNPVPTIWIAKKVEHIDPTFLRRFDLVVEVPALPRAVRPRSHDSQTD